MIAKSFLVRRMKFLKANLTKKFLSSLFKVNLGQKIRKRSKYGTLKQNGLYRDHSPAWANIIFWFSAQVHDRIYLKFSFGISQIRYWKGGVRIPRRTGINGIFHLFRTKIFQFQLRISGDFSEKKMSAPLNYGIKNQIYCLFHKFCSTI